MMMPQQQAQQQQQQLTQEADAPGEAEAPPPPQQQAQQQQQQQLAPEADVAAGEVEAPPPPQPPVGQAILSPQPPGGWPVDGAVRELLIAVKRGDALAVAATLAAEGLPGSKAVRELLEAGYHAAFRHACQRGKLAVARALLDAGYGPAHANLGLDADFSYALRQSAAGGHAGVVSLLLAAYCGAPGGPAVLHGLSACDHEPLRAAAAGGHAAAVAALLEAYGRCGALAAALAAGGPQGDAFTLAQDLDTWGHVVAAYGGPESPVLQRALARHNHRRLRTAAMGGHTLVVAATAAAYGSAGCDAVLSALAADSHGALRYAARYGHADALAAVIAAYGDRRDALLEGLAAGGGGDGGGGYALLEAARNGHAAALAVLLAAAGGDLKGTVAVTATLEAGRGGHAEVLAALAPLVTEAMRRESLRLAARGGHVTAARALLAASDPAAGGALGALEDNDHGALRAAIAGGHRRIVAALVDAYGGRGGPRVEGAVAAWLTTLEEAAVRAIPADGALARLAVQSPLLWRRFGDVSRTLLSGRMRAALAMPLLLALGRLDKERQGGLAGALSEFLQRRRWCLYGAAPPPGLAVEPAAATAAAAAGATAADAAAVPAAGAEQAAHH